MTDALREPILVTGGSGFIGRALVARLISEERQVLAPRRRQLDLRDWDQVESFFTQHRPKTVFHLAGSVKGRRDCREFLESFHSNTVSTVHVLEACRRFGLARLISVGTGDESGTKEDTGGLLDPSLAKRPRSVYAATKAASTLFCEAASRFSELQPTVLRLLAVYGHGQSTDFLIPQLVQAAKENRTLAMTGGHQRRDFLWLDDVLEVLIRIAGCEASKGRTVDVCTGKICSLREIVGLVSELSGVKDLASFSQVDYRPGEPFTIAGNPEPLLELIGPFEFTTPREGLATLLSSKNQEPKDR